MTDIREPVINNIKKAVAAGDFHRKVEVNDPNVSRADIDQILTDYVREQPTLRFKTKQLVARHYLSLLTDAINWRTEIVGLNNLSGLHGGAIVTSNHFSPFENTAIRKAIRKAGYKKLAIVSQASNNEMTGILGFFMNYADVIPIANSLNYLGHEFPKLLKKQLDNGVPILIYPEQEMWYNYRKPRPPQRGAYFYAATFNVPIISCFIEIIDLNKPASEAFNKVRYRVHILKPIFPNPTMSVRQNSLAMMQQDYQQKKDAYQEAYHIPLTYTFQPHDIAGWRH